MPVFDQQTIYKELQNRGVPEPDAKILSAVAHSESGLNTMIAGDSGKSWGLFQIYIPAHYDKLARLTGSNSQDTWIEWLKDPINNIAAAVEVYNSQGLGAWTEYNNGNYKQYLDGSNPFGGSGSSTGTIDSQNATIKNWDQSLWDKVKSKAEDTWYWLKGSSREYSITPPAAEQLKAREQFNSKYGLELPTAALEKQVEYENSLDLSNKLITAGILALMLLLVFIVGAYAFFKAFDLTPPGPMNLLK